MLPKASFLVDTYGPVSRENNGTSRLINGPGALRDSRGNSQNRPLWALSMGDLLTLLLSFFLSIIAASLKQAPAKPQVGTALAVIDSIATGEPSQTTVRLGQESFRRNGPGLSEYGRKVLESKLNAVKDQYSEVNVKGCLEEQQIYSEGDWAVSIERVVAVVSQLIDTGVAQKMIRAEAISRCPDAVEIDFVAAHHGRR